MNILYALYHYLLLDSDFNIDGIPVSAIDNYLASRKRRFCACCVDMLTCWTVGFAGALLFAEASKARTTTEDIITSINKFPYSLLLNALSLLGNVFVYWMGPGRYVTGIKIVQLEDGKEISAKVRYITC